MLKMKTKRHKKSHKNAAPAENKITCSLPFMVGVEFGQVTRAVASADWTLFIAICRNGERNIMTYVAEEHVFRSTWLLGLGDQ